MTDGSFPASNLKSAPTAVEAERFHSLDALRAFALLLGVFFHAAESFEPGVETYYPVADVSPSVALGVFRHACTSFRLEIFFLLAGFFGRLLYHRRGQREFIRNRLSRILVPLLVGWGALYPLLVYIWLLGASISGRLSQFGVPSDMAQAPASLLTLGFFARFQFVKHFNLTHLWFLHQLLVLYALALLIRAGWHTWFDLNGRRLGWVDGRVAALFGTRWQLVLLALLTVPMLLLMNSWKVDTPTTSLLPHGPTTLLFGFQFGLGWLLHRQPQLLERCANGWWVPMLLGVAMVWPADALVAWLRCLGITPGNAPWVRPLHAVLYALMMWGFVLGFLGAFVRFRRTSSVTWRYIADASYWIYIAHLPLVVWLQVQVGRWPQHWTVKYLFILAITMPVLFLSYQHLVRATFIGQQLNGRKYPQRKNSS